MSTDIIDLLAGLELDSALAALRMRRPAARENAQRSFHALFAPHDPGSVTVRERWAIAAFVAVLHDPVIGAFYLEKLAGPDVDAVLDEATRAASSGPYGHYREPALAGESTAGLRYAAAGTGRTVLGGRLAAGLEHAHLVVFRPRESSPAALQTLLDAGWSETDIVTISQLISFLAFQIRVVVALRALAEDPIAPVEEVSA